MRHTHATVLAAFMAAFWTASPLLAADSTELKLKGTVAPASCTPWFANHGTIDYGKISAGLLRDDDYATLEAKQIGFRVTCAAPARVALKAQSGRPGSTVTQGAEGAGGFAPAPVALFGEAAGTVSAAGLGLAGNAAKIGGFSARIKLGAPTNKDQIVSVDNGNTWAMAAEPIVVTLNDALTSWASRGTTDPVAISSLSGTMEVQAYLNKASELDLSQNVKLDGLVTFEIVYL